MIALKCTLLNGWKLSRLAELCEINPSKPEGFERSANAPTTFIPMEAVDDKTGAVVAPQVRPYSKVARGYTYFEEGDVIFAKITPCMQNGKTAIVTGLLGGVGFGSTEFHVFRARPGVDSRWIYHLLRSAEFRRKAEENFEGSAGQRRIPEHFLEDVHVPFQEDGNARDTSIKRLDEAMRELYRMRAAIERQVEAADSLGSRLIQGFFSYEPSSALPNGWIWVKTADAIEPQVEMFNRNTFAQPQFTYIDISSVDNATKRIISPAVISAKEAPSRATYLVKPGDILVSTVRPNLNAVAMVEARHDGAVCSSGFCVLRFKKEFCPKYFLHFFISPQFVSAATKTVQGAMYPAISDDDVTAFEIAAPAPFDQQQQIGELMDAKWNNLQKIRTASHRQQEAISVLPAAALREFFNFGNGVHA